MNANQKFESCLLHRQENRPASPKFTRMLPSFLAIDPSVRGSVGRSLVSCRLHVSSR